MSTPIPPDVVREALEWLDNPHRADGPHDQQLRMYEVLAQVCAARARQYAETAAWCRLAVGLLRGDDVPDSIYPAPDEDPADTARWRRWRLPSDGLPDAGP
jgi:hypothetical protein